MPPYTIAPPPHRSLRVPAAFYADDSPPMPPPGDPHRREWEQPPPANGSLSRWLPPAVVTGIVVFWGALFVLLFIVH